jgi:predicted nucleic acid-binding protein
VTLLDAYAIVAFVAEERAAAEVDGILRQGSSAVTSVNLAEALDVLVRTHGVPGRYAREIIEPLVDDSIVLVAPGWTEASHAAEIRARRYDRRKRDLSLADCFLLGTAATHGHEVATSDPAVAATAREEGIALVPLPDRFGKRP